MRLKLLLFTMFAALLTTACNEAVLNEEPVPTPIPEKPDRDNPKNETFEDKFFTDVLDLDYPGLEKVKAAFEKGEKYRAMTHLLDYYRMRSSVIHPDVSMANPSPTNVETTIANNALEYKFVSVTTGDAAGNVYEDYKVAGKDSIDWAHHSDENEVMWQVHRHKWFVPLAKMYRSTGDEKWFTAWQTQYADWIKCNRPVAENLNREFSWRALEAGERVKVQSEMIFYFIGSPNYTPEWLYVVLNEVRFTTDFVVANYAATGNHRILQSQGVTYAGCIFPELKKSSSWFESGKSVLSEAVREQVLDDGMHYELDYGYHIGSIADFIGGYNIARVNNKSFPSDYVAGLRKMMEVVKNITLPNYSIPQFNDTRSSSYSQGVLSRNFRTYYSLFLDGLDYLWLGNAGANGTKPSTLNAYFKTSGYYVLRSGWDKNSIVMVHSNGPNGIGQGFHKHPDNGTFELYAGDKNFFPDSGVYQYEGSGEVNAQREFFRQTRMHNTLTLGFDNIAAENMHGQCLLSETTDNTDVVVTRNTSYANLEHRRAIFFVNKSFFVIVDDASGAFSGITNLNYHLLDGSNVQLDLSSNGAHTTYSSGYNVFVRTFSPGSISSTQFAEGAVSYSIGVKKDRPNSCWYVAQSKISEAAIRYITVIYPAQGDVSATTATASFDRDWSATSDAVTVTLNGTTHKLSYTL